MKESETELFVGLRDPLEAPGVWAAEEILDAGAFRHYIDTFNHDDRELYRASIPNDQAWAFLRENMPLFECPDRELELTYYFRWWTYRKHLRQTQDGFVITEFLPDVPWASKHNTVNLTACLHLAEGRWLRNSRFLDDYSRFWFRHGGTISGPRSYTSWLFHAIHERALVTGDQSLANELLDDAVANYRGWEAGWSLKCWYTSTDYRIGQHQNGLFFTLDDRDGGEVSIGGHGYRPLINSAMAGEAAAIADVAAKSGRQALADEFAGKAEQIRKLMLDLLWSPRQEFFLIRGGDGAPKDVRELYGYAPWYFGLAPEDCDGAWRQMTDPHGFQAPFGLTFPEQRHPEFRLSYEGHECQWNGPVWPLATAMTLSALIRLLHDRRSPAVTERVFFDAMLTYGRSHRRVREDGRIVPWIDENLHPYTGDWISRTRLKSWENGTWSAAKGGEERGKDYNHSTFCDLVITGLAGLRPRADEVVEVAPLLPAGAWDYFCLDRIPYHGRLLTILYDRTGERYRKGKGLRVLADGREIAGADRLERVSGRLP